MHSRLACAVERITSEGEARGQGALVVGRKAPTEHKGGYVEPTRPGASPEPPPCTRSSANFLPSKHGELFNVLMRHEPTLSPGMRALEGPLGWSPIHNSA